jgi:serine protease
MNPLQTLLCATLVGVASFPASAGKNVSGGSPSASRAAAVDGDRFIVRFRDRSTDPRQALNGIGGTFGERLEHLRGMSGGAHVVRLGRRVMRDEAQRVAGLLRRDARIAAIEPDAWMQPMAVPNDTMYGLQWHYHEPQGGINLPTAWDVTVGASGATVAVIDTGVAPHADLSGRLATGYDFIRNVVGGTDPGDYGCEGASSSWHGTHVAGIVGASSNNGVGVAGSNWVSKILPVRVLGRCGGFTSDIIDGLRWAAGMAVAGAPANPTPARVANLSLGGDGACSGAFQSAINDVTARGMVVVVAAGNAGSDVGNAQPANCSGVVAVAATTRSGGRAAYSNHGSRVTLSAPGGGGGDGVLSTVNTGSTTPAADGYAWFQGTSMAAPHVTGVVSLLLSVDPTLTPAQVAQRLQQSARPFPGGTGADCTVGVCGAGILDAGAALAGLLGAPPPPAPAPPPPGAGWTKLADEGQGFAVNGTQTVRYGSEPHWVTRQVENSGNCTNAFFGADPIYGTPKRCEGAGGTAQPPVSGWAQVAWEGETFFVNGTQTVRYGSGSSWVTRSVSGAAACSNELFGGDPVYGIVKQCETAAATSTARR